MAYINEQKGQFWWFGEEGPTSSIEHSVHGLLTIGEEGQIALQLEGSLWLDNPNVSFEWDDSRWLPTDKRIVGLLGEYGAAGYVLLCELLRTDYSLSDEPARQSYEADYCFKCDCVFPVNFTIGIFHTLRIEFEGLETWLQLQSIYEGPETRHDKQVEFTIRYDKIEIAYETSQGKVSIQNLILGAPTLWSSYFNAPVASVNIRQTNWLVYEPRDQLSLSQFQAFFRRVEEVIALLIGHYFRLDWPTLIAKFSGLDNWFSFHWKRGIKRQKVPPDYFMMIRFPEVRENFGSMLDLWVQGAAKYGAGYDLYIASMQQPLPYAEHAFVNLVWAVESLHRSWQRDAGESSELQRKRKKTEDVLARFSEKSDRKLKLWLAGKLKYACDPTLEDRIVETFQRLPLNFDAEALRKFANKCAKRRNDISHEGGKRPGENAESFRAELRQLADALRYLVHALLLNEIGLSQELLLMAFTRGGTGAMQVVPALRAVGLELLMTPQTDKTL